DGMLGEGRSHMLGVFSAQRSVDDHGRWGWGWGGTGAARLSGDESLWLQEGWIEGRYGILHLEAGRRVYTLGETGPHRLSSGSLVLGRNAPPVPRIRLHIPEYVPVPYLQGWASFKGHWAHGWFGKDRVIENAYLHEKSFYVQFGGPTWWKLYGGFLHTATWGGRESDTGRQYPAGLGDFLRVATARAGDNTSHGVDQANVLGAHQGLIDTGFKMEAGGDRRVHLYRQHLFSDKSGLALRNLPDGLYGVAVENPFGESISWIDGVLWEFLHTKHQTGPGPTDPVVGDSPPFCAEVNPNCGYRYNGRDDYYNNEVYLDGWAYKGYSMGSPLLMTQRQLDQIDPSIETYSDRYFVSTRVVAHHGGVEGHVGDAAHWRVLGTYARHYGTYWGLNLGDVWGSLDPALDPEVYYFNPPRIQWHWLAETDWVVPGRENITLRFSLALDHGEMFESIGLTAGVIWTLR
ncbi:MAG: capsule assembly Wzi family protein, partial [Bacteroidota bacterium]